MKIMTILGTRPEIIRLSRIIARLDVSVEHVLVHTGQNFDRRLSDIFFEALGVRPPDHLLEVGACPFGEQAGRILSGVEQVIEREHPDRVLILGDTNSALAAIVAKRRGIPVFHMEAGNRCHDDRVPEEVNRRIVDHCSDVLLPYTERSRDNLLAEGIPARRIFVTGNPIAEVIEHHREAIATSGILETLGLRPGGYFLVTLHRAENVDLAPRRRALLEGLVGLAEAFGRPVILSTHPRLRAQLDSSEVALSDRLMFHSPFGFFDFLKLQREAYCVLSDSGTVQEECTLLKVPSVTLRDVTERPETLECGANMLAGADAATLMRAVRLVTSSPSQWAVPAEYQRLDVSETVVRLLTAYHHRLGGA